MNSKLRQELEAMKNLQTGDSFTAEHVHTLVDGILEGVGEFKYVNYDSTSFPYPQTIGSTADSIVGLGNADESMIDTIFIMPNKETDSTATMMIVVDEVDPSTDPKTYQYVYVGNINSLPSDVLTEESIVDNLTTERNDRPLSAKQGRTLNSHVNYITCGSGAADQVKLISDDGFELSTHLRLLVKMNNTNTNSTPKFNINNTGAKDVWYNGAVASDTNTWSAGEVLDVYYDGSNNFVANTHGGAQFSTGEKVSDVGIDDEPTAGSDNLVKSGGIYESEQEIYKEYLRIPFDSKGYINNSGTISGSSDASNHRTNLVSVSEGEVFIYSGVGVSGVNGLVWGYSSESLEDAQILVQSTTSAITKTEFTIPESVSFIIAWSRGATLRELFKKSSYEERISEIEPVQSLGNSTTKTLSQSVISKQLVAKDNGITKDLTVNFRSSGILECKLWTTKSDYTDEVEVGITYLGIQNNVFYFFFKYEGSQKQLSQSVAELSAGKHTFVFTEISISGLATVFAKVTIDTNIFVRYTKAEGDELYTLLRKVDNEFNLEFSNYVTKSDIPNIQTPCIEYSDSLVYSENVPYKLIYTSRLNVNGINYMANDTPAPYSGIISKIKFISPAGKPFTVSTAEALGSNNFKFTRTKTVTPSTTGMQELVINLPISEGEFVFYGQDGTDTQQFPGYTTNASVMSDNGKKVYWLKSNPTIGQSYYCGPNTTFVCNAVYTINKYKFQEAGTIPNRKINYITVTRNADNFNSIRELMANITDATEYNQYIIVVPDGEWFECDLVGKKYVKIKGQSKNNTIIYCDGTSDKLTPSDYSYSSYQSVALSSVPRIDKHVIMSSADIEIENVTLKAISCKYIIHGDKGGWNNIKINNCLLVADNVNSLVGFGLRGEQSFYAENCEFKKLLETSQVAIYAHNWQWTSTTALGIPVGGAGGRVSLKNCKFNNGSVLFQLGEIASYNDDIIIFENCDIEGTTKKFQYYVEKDNGVPLAKDLNGDIITDPLDVPYCWQVNLVKSGSVTITTSTERPNYETIINIIS